MNRRISLYMCGLLLAFAAQINAAETLKVDTATSKVDFVGSKDNGKHVGGFKKVEGTAVVNHETPSNSSLKLAIDTKSIWSDDDKLTAHLSNADFFNVREFPTITFESTKVTVKDDNVGEIVGKLTMLGKTVETTVPVTVESMDAELHLHAKFKIDRTLWGMKYGVGKIKNEVDLDAHLILKK
jgi:polyisoprenoid-binding protein YceI